MFILLVNGLLVVAVCLFVLVCGDWRARLAGGMYLAAYAVNYVLNYALTPAIFARPEWSYLLSGSGLLIGFVYLSWKSPRPWPIWACAGQLMSVAAAIASLVHDIQPRPFLVLQMLIGYGVLLAILMGTVAAVRSKGHAPLK